MLIINKIYKFELVVESWECHNTKTNFAILILTPTLFHIFIASTLQFAESTFPLFAYRLILLLILSQAHTKKFWNRTVYFLVVL